MTIEPSTSEPSAAISESASQPAARSLEGPPSSSLGSILPSSVAELQHRVRAQAKTIDVLTRQIGKSQSERGSALEHLRRNLVLREVVDRKTEELDRRNRDMRLLLDHVAEGFLTVNRDGVISDERSSAVNRWLGEAPAGTTLWDYIGCVDPAAGFRARLAWQLVTDGILPRDVVLAQLPPGFTDGERDFHITYRSVVDDGIDFLLLVVITDVTLEREKARTEEREREVLRAFEHVVRDRRGFFEFLDEADELVRKVGSLAGRGGDLAGLAGGLAAVEGWMALHTLKGACGLFGFSSVARICHEAEEAREHDSAEIGVVVARVREAWDRATSMFRNLRREREKDGVVELTRQELEDIVHALERGVPTPAIARHLHTLKMGPLAKRFERLAETARSIASRLGKEIEVHIDDGDLLIDGAAWSALFLVLPHLVRNAVDHGIEYPDDRIAKGKPAIGRLDLACALVDDVFELRIVDDGRGIDWAKIAERARAVGRPAVTRDDLRAMLGTPGVSTRDETTDISGRGVGLAAVLRCVDELGGTVEIQDAPAGAGTGFTIRFPRRPGCEDVACVADRRLLVDEQRRAARTKPSFANGTRLGRPIRDENQ